jgi:hypothetical protein
MHSVGGHYSLLTIHITYYCLLITHYSLLTSALTTYLKGAWLRSAATALRASLSDANIRRPKETLYRCT